MDYLNHLSFGVIVRFGAIGVIALPVILFASSGDKQQDEPKEAVKQGGIIDVKSVSGELGNIVLTLDCPVVLKSGHANMIEILIHNRSDELVVYNPNAGLPSIKLEVMRGGRVVEPTYIGSISFGHLRRHVGNVRPTGMESGQAVRSVVNLTRYFDLSRVGEYQIRASWWGFRNGDPEKLVRVTTEWVKVDVVVLPGETKDPSPVKYAEGKRVGWVERCTVRWVERSGPTVRGGSVRS